MKVTVTIDGGAAIDVSANAVTQIVASVPDVPEHQAFFRAIAGHPSSEVRARLACNSALPADVVQRLATDPCVEVRRNVLRTDAGRAHLSEDVLCALAEGAVECAEEIALSLTGYQLETNRLGELLVAHPDPRVRLALTSASATPKALLRRLAQDADPEIRHAATNALR